MSENVRFIRKNGKVIPIRDDGKGGTREVRNKNPKAAKKHAKTSSEEGGKYVKASSRAQATKTKFRKTAAIGGGIAGALLSRNKLAGATVGFVSGAVAGQGAGHFASRKDRAAAQKHRQKSRAADKRGIKASGSADRHAANVISEDMRR